jgi:ATP-dependent Zn protease
MMADLDVCMAGRVAEEVIFGTDEVTSGASSDLMQASRLAREMVTKWGMSEGVGPVYHGGSSGPETHDAIDREVRALLDASYARAKKLISKHRRDLDRLAKALLEYETLTGEEVEKVHIDVRVSKAAPPSNRTYHLYCIHTTCALPLANTLLIGHLC